MLKKLDPRILKGVGAVIGSIVFSLVTVMFISNEPDEIPYNDELPPWGDESGEELGSAEE